MLRQIQFVLVVSLMFYVAPAFANDNPVKDGKQSTKKVKIEVNRAPFTSLAPGDNGNPFPSGQLNTFSAPALADIDNDGDFDMFSGSEPGGILYYENTGDAASPAFTERTGGDNPMGSFDPADVFTENETKTTVALVDIDGDGDYDLFLGAEEGKFAYYQNTGDNANPTYASVTGASNPLDGIDVGNRSQVTFVDLDGDGDYDAVMGAFDGTLTYYINDGDVNTPNFALASGGNDPFSAISVGGSNLSKVALGDIDLDGDYDLVVGSKTDGDLRYFENDGSTNAPSFTEKTGADNPFNTMNVGAGKESTPAIINLQSGNGTDVIVGNTDGDFYFILNGDPLPVELSSFDAVRNLNQVTLTWTTASETNNAGFEIQKRTRRGYEAVAWVPGAGTTTEARSYSYTIKRLQPGRQVFRLKQVDFDGAVDYSPEASANISLEASFYMSKTAPEPFNPQTTFNLTVAKSQQVTVAVYDMQGRMVQLLHSGELQAEQPYQFYVQANSWASGKYLIRAVGEAFNASQVVTLLK